MNNQGPHAEHALDGPHASIEMEVDKMAAKNTIPENVWEEQEALYELGFKHGNQIARDLGLSPATVCRHMKRRGARKGCRVKETIKDLEMALDRKARCAALMDLTDSERRRQVQKANAEAIGQMIAALLEADKKGDLSLAAAVIDRVGSMPGQKQKRRR